MSYARATSDRSTFLDDVIAEIDLEAWLDDNGIDHRRVAGGSNLNLKECPFCHDARWRVYVSAENKRGLCFHSDCDRRFNFWSFVRAHLECDNAGVGRHLEDYAARTTGMRRKKAQAPRRVIAPEGWQLPPNVALPAEDGATHPYLVQRRILLSTQRHFDLRWCEEGWYRWERSDGERKALPFSGRILLPIYDLDGFITTFVGRDATGTQEVRYLFPPELPSAARYLYGGNHLLGAEHVVVGEGPFDAIAIHQAVDGHPAFHGVRATASFGLAIGHGEQDGNDQLGRFLRLRNAGMKRLTLLWDGEANAFKRATEAAAMLRSKLSGVEVGLGTLPADSDPAELDTEVVRRAIAGRKVVSPTALLGWRLNNPYAVSHR